MINDETKAILHKRDADAHKQADVEFDAMSPAEHMEAAKECLKNAQAALEDLKALLYV